MSAVSWAFLRGQHPEVPQSPASEVPPPAEKPWQWTLGSFFPNLWRLATLLTQGGLRVVLWPLLAPLRLLWAIWRRLVGAVAYVHAERRQQAAHQRWQAEQAVQAKAAEQREQAQQVHRAEEAWELAQERELLLKALSE